MVNNYFVYNSHHTPWNTKPKWREDLGIIKIVQCNFLLDKQGSSCFYCRTRHIMGMPHLNLIKAALSLAKWRQVRIKAIPEQIPSKHTATM